MSALDWIKTPKVPNRKWAKAPKTHIWRRTYVCRYCEKPLPRGWYKRHLAKHYKELLDRLKSRI